MLMRYGWNVLSLLLAREISCRTAVMALRKRPAAVAGKRGGFIVDPEFEKGSTRRLEDEYE